MFIKVIKNKLRAALTLLLAFAFISQLAPITVFAGGNPAQVGATGGSQSVSPDKILWAPGGMAIFLTNDPQYVMSNNELLFRVDPEENPDPDYWEKMSGYDGYNMLKAYAQIFKRSQVSWSRDEVKNSILFFGSDIVNEAVQGGITYTSLNGGDQANYATLGKHSIRYYEGGGRRDYFNTLAKNKSFNGWRPISDGSGVFKRRIVEYLNAYFDNPSESMNPHDWLQDVFNNPDNYVPGAAQQSMRIWSYIAAGIDALNKQTNTNGPGQRWEEVFVNPHELKWGSTYMTKDNGLQEWWQGLTGSFNTPKWGEGSWEGDDPNKVANQVAGYLDSLLTVALTVKYEGSRGGTSAVNSNIAQQYLKAAKDVFGREGAIIERPEQMEQTNSLVVQRWIGENWNQYSVGGRVVDYFDFWAIYHNSKKYVSDASTIVGDYRKSIWYNDLEQNPVAANSPVYQEWSNYGSSASADRIALRLFMQSEPKKLRIGNKNADVNIGNMFVPGTYGLGFTAAALGRSIGATDDDTIYKGLSVNGKQFGDLSGSESAVGGQFLIGMFAQAGISSGNPSTPFTHSIHAFPQEETIEPNVSERLGQKPKIRYRLGTGFGESDIWRYANNSPATTDEFYKTAEDAVLTKGAQLQMRTAFSSKVEQYTLAHIGDHDGEPGDPLYPPKDSNGSWLVWETSEREPIPGVRTALGTTTINNLNINEGNWSPIDYVALNNFIYGGEALFEYNDNRFESKGWPMVPEAHRQELQVNGQTEIWIFYPGADYWLHITYWADTQIRIAYPDGTVMPVSYSEVHRDDASVTAAMTATGASTPGEVPIFLAMAPTDTYNEVSTSVKYKFYQPPKKQPVVKEPLQYMVYSSSPEAYAELKNWGVASYNEPGDINGYGTGRSPVDTEAGVQEEFRSNGSSLITEDYEAMAGVPTTEKLYLAVGGSEFIVDMAVQYVPNETAIRAYRSSFNGVACQFNYEGASGSGADIPNAAHFNLSAIPKPTVSGATINVDVNAPNPHEGYTVTLTASGSIRNDGVNDTQSDTKTSLHSATASASAHHIAIPNTTDVATFNNSMTAVENWCNDMVAYFNAIPGFQAGSDKVTRKIGDSTSSAFIVNRLDNAGTQGGSGSLSMSVPAGDFFKIADDGTNTALNLIRFSGFNYSVTNPADTFASDSKSASVGCSAGEDTPCGNEQATASVTVTAYKSDTTTWEMSVTFTVEPHVICGPCDNHSLPPIYDTWQQSFNYDYMKIIGLAVLRLDQGSATDTTSNGSGLKALIGTQKLGVTRQTFYSAPSYNIAQANIFNYMGLQTDGTKDVNTATNEYFRSLAIGSGSLGQTQSSEAGRVRYWVTNADESALTAKGTSFNRLTYTGNTASQAPFNNELDNNWGDGISKAHDVVEYLFGDRSNICDGTSRGYQYNVNKSSWVENIGGSWRGKAAYDLPWAKGFLYDGIGAGSESGANNSSTIGSMGFSVSKSYRNSGRGNNYANGIVQDGTKGWQGQGMTITSQMMNVYPAAFENAYASNMPTQQYTRNRDWDVKLHDQPYTDTRQMRPSRGKPGGFTWTDALGGDVAPRNWVSGAFDSYPQNPTTIYEHSSNPYNNSEMLTAYTNTAINGSGQNRAQDTNEYKLMLQKRKEKVQATVISDALVLELPSGVQPLMYFYRNAAALAEVDERIPDTRVSYDEMWTNNPFTPAKFIKGGTGTSADSIAIGGYNGEISSTQVTWQDNQTRYHGRYDMTPGVVITTDAADELANNYCKSKVLHGANINMYFAHNGSTRVLSALTNNPSTAPIPNRTLLYNVTPIQLSATNREYRPGVAEVFWETIIQYKDSSNHDYYSVYQESTFKVKKYLSEGEFVRIPELLGNSGQTKRDETLHTRANGEELLKEGGVYYNYFIDENELPAIGAAEARAAQAEQYGRGFAVTGYNYDSTNKTTVDGKYNRQLYNASPDLTGAAKGAAYNSDGFIGLPYIVEGVYDNSFNTGLATKRIGQAGANSIPKSGYIQQAAYTKRDGEVGQYTLNPLVIHTPITARPVQIMPVAEWRDQRVYGQSSVALAREQKKVGCPGLAHLCKYAVPACKYVRYDDDGNVIPMEFLNLNLVGSGNSVTNTAINAQTSGNILLAGGFIRTSTGLTSGGSARSGVPLSTIGATYKPTLNYRVTATGVTYTANKGEQMLFGFERYGITLNTSTQKLYIRLFGNTGYLEVDGTFASGSNLEVEFGSSNAAQSRVKVNGALRTLTPMGGTASAMVVGSGDIGANFYLGAWNIASNPSYTWDSNTRIRGIIFERMSGSFDHGVECMSMVMRHVGGNNTHIHDQTHLGSATSTSYLSGTLLEWEEGRISEDVLRDRLGADVFNAVRNIGTPMETKVDELLKLSPLGEWYHGSGCTYSGQTHITSSTTYCTQCGHSCGYLVGAGASTETKTYTINITGGNMILSARLGTILGDPNMVLRNTDGTVIATAGGVTSDMHKAACVSYDKYNLAMTQHYTCNGLPINAGGSDGTEYCWSGVTFNETAARACTNRQCQYSQDINNPPPGCNIFDTLCKGAGWKCLGHTTPNDRHDHNTSCPSSYNWQDFGLTQPPATYETITAAWVQSQTAQALKYILDCNCKANSYIRMSLPPGTYTITVATTPGVISEMQVLIRLGRPVTYQDIIDLPNINGTDAWRSIPFYLSNGARNPVWMCDGELNRHICNGCYEEVSYDTCTEPHHQGRCYEDSLCIDPCMDDNKHDTQFVQDRNVNTPAAEFVSIDWDYTLYAGTVDNFRATANYQLTALQQRTGRGYYDDMELVRFTRGKYVKFPWYALYDGVLYSPGQWITLGDRGDYAAGLTANANGLGGNKQNSSGNAWHNEQQAMYNVRNWSLYGQAVYQDLYKDFYDFYIPLANDEINLGEVMYATIAVNAPTGKNSTGLPTALGEVTSWSRGGAVNNHNRNLNIAEYGASKAFYVDLVGRIGGLVVQDVTDVKFSNTFKEARKTTENVIKPFVVNTVNPAAPDALQASSTANISSGGVNLWSVGEWTGFDFNADNERNFVLTVTGNNLRACELEIAMYDGDNKDYMLRITDMVVIQAGESAITVQFSAKPTNSSVILKPRMVLVDDTAGGASVAKMELAYGGTGYSHGLSKEVDQTKQNYYVTDVVDVRGIYLNQTHNLDLGTEAWIRYDTYGTGSRPSDWIRLSEATQVRDGKGISQRETPVFGTRAVNTYGTRPWVEVNDPLYSAWIENGGRALRGPLSSAHNVIEQYRTPEDQLSVGSHILYDVTTLGNYYSTDARLEIIPTYYAVDLSSGKAELTPVDIYQLSSSGEYAEVNIFGAPYNGFSNADLDKFNRYRLDVKWENEAEGIFNRRNVTPREMDAAKMYSDTFRAPIFSGGTLDPNRDIDPDTFEGNFAGFSETTREIPSGIMPVGGAQLVVQDYKTQTYIGSNRTYGVAKDGGTFAGLSDPHNEHPRYLYWEIAAQRWHTVLGLPSDSVFVPLDRKAGDVDYCWTGLLTGLNNAAKARACINSYCRVDGQFNCKFDFGMVCMGGGIECRGHTKAGTFTHPSKDEITSKALDISKTLIVVYIDVFSYGDVWNLRYGANGIQRKLSLEGTDYELPVDPPGAGTADGYPGSGEISSELVNPGIPIACFGGNKVPELADIIKIN